MRRSLLTIITVLSLSLVPAGLALGTTAAASPSCPDETTARGQVLKGIGQTGSECDDRGVENAIKTVVNILSIIVGVVAVIVVIYSGLKYITSGGDSGKIGNAKNTLIYALVGLIVAALAQVLVHFVLFQASQATEKSCPTGRHRSADGRSCVPD
jgi:hypothetical protein